MIRADGQLKDVGPDAIIEYMLLQVVDGGLIGVQCDAFGAWLIDVIDQQGECSQMIDVRMRQEDRVDLFCSASGISANAPASKASWSSTT